MRVTWGDYVTEPPLSTMQLTEEGAAEPEVEWLRQPRDELVELPVPERRQGPAGRWCRTAPRRGCPAGRSSWSPMRDRSPSRFPGRRHARCARSACSSSTGARPRAGVTPTWRMHFRRGWRSAARRVWCRGAISRRMRSDDEDQRIADLHYRDEVEYAVGRNSSAGWEAPDEAGVVRRAWTDPLPMAEVERVAPNEDIRDVEFGMEALAELAAGDGEALVSALEELPVQYAAWTKGQRALLGGFARAAP